MAASIVRVYTRVYTLKGLIVNFRRPLAVAQTREMLFVCVALKNADSLLNTPHTIAVIQSACLCYAHLQMCVIGQMFVCDMRFRFEVRYVTLRKV